MQVQKQGQVVARIRRLIVGVGRLFVVCLFVIALFIDPGFAFPNLSGSTFAVSESDVGTDPFPMRAMRCVLGYPVLACRLAMGEQIIESWAVFTGLAAGLLPTGPLQRDA
ncbi:hypothetical protein [Mesorhizobium sp. 1M-11]|uniref:hypothetical protein n=1 Tax=Mesorhizobium sp. 1M-11 TaxID=1529006 RepID=UPI001FCD6452|nr:hypothetical protein [Mesorhizobium sp. 1M-11]